MIILGSLLFLIQLSLMAQEKDLFTCEKQLVKTCVNFNNAFNGLLKNTHYKEDLVDFDIVQEKIQFFNNAYYDFKHTILKAPAIQIAPFFKHFKCGFDTLAFPENFINQSIEQRQKILQTMSLQRDWFFEAMAFMYGKKPVKDTLFDEYEHTKQVAWESLNLKEDKINKEVDGLKNQLNRLAVQIKNLLNVQEAQFANYDDQDLTADDSTSIQSAVNDLQNTHSFIKKIELCNETFQEIPYSRYAVLPLVNDISKKLDIFFNEYDKNSIITGNQRERLKLYAEDLNKISRKLTWQTFQKVATHFPFKNESISEKFIESIGELRAYNKETNPITEANIITQWGDAFVNTVGNFCDGTTVKNTFSGMMAKYIPALKASCYGQIEEQLQEAKITNSNIFTKKTDTVPVASNVLATFMNQGPSGVIQNIAADLKPTVNNALFDGMNKVQKAVKEQKDLKKIHKLSLEYFLKAMTFAFYKHCTEIDALKPIETLSYYDRTLFAVIYQGEELNKEVPIIKSNDSLLLNVNNKSEFTIELEQEQINQGNGELSDLQNSLIISIDAAPNLPISISNNKLVKPMDVSPNTLRQSCISVFTQSGRSALEVFQSSMDQLKNAGENITIKWNTLYESLEYGQELMQEIEGEIQQGKIKLVENSLIRDMPNKNFKESFEKLINTNQNVAEILIDTLPKAVLEYLAVLGDDKVLIETLWHDPKFLELVKNNINEHIKRCNAGLINLQNAVRNKSIGKLLLYLSRIEAGDEKLRALMPVYRFIKTILECVIFCLNELLAFSEKGTIALYHSVKREMARTIVRCAQINNEKIETATMLCNMLQDYQEQYAVV